MIKIKEKIKKMETGFVNRPDSMTEIINSIEEFDKEKNGTAEKIIISNTLFSVPTKFGVTLESLVVRLTDSKDTEIVKSAYKLLAAKANFIKSLATKEVKEEIEIFTVNREDYNKIIEKIKEM